MGSFERKIDEVLDANSSKPLSVFLYGHYDSRGGTTAVEAKDRETADTAYAEYYWPGEEAAKGAAAEDFMGEAVLSDVPDTMDKEDLEDSGKVLIMTGPNVKAKEDEFVRISGVAQLRYVRDTQIPDPGIDLGKRKKNRWVHPRWDDDAFSFFLLRTSNNSDISPESIAGEMG